MGEVNKSMCKYNTRQNNANDIREVKTKALQGSDGTLKDFHNRFTLFYSGTKIRYLPQLQGVCLTFLNVNDVRTPLLLKVKSPASLVIIPLLCPLDAWTVSNFLGVILKTMLK